MSRLIKEFTTAVLLAWNNIKYNWSISLVMVLIISAVYINLSFVPSLLNGFSTTIVQQLIASSTANIIVKPSAGNKYILNADRIVKDFESEPGVFAAVAQHMLAAEISNKDDFNAYEIVAVNPQKHQSVYKIAESIVDGEFIDINSTDEIVLGKQIAPLGDENTELYAVPLKEVEVGDKVTVKYSFGVEKEYIVKGVFDSEFIEADMRAYISDKELALLRPELKSTATQINVKKDQGYQEEELITQLEAMQPTLRYEPWWFASGIVKNVTQSFGLINTIVSFVGVMVAIFTIFVIVQIDLTNKRRQIGIMRAIGIRPQVIIFNYLVQAIFYTTTAISLGIILLTQIIAKYIELNPLEFPFGRSQLAISGSDLLFISLLLISTSIVSASLPVLKSISKNITTEIRSH